MDGVLLAFLLQDGDQPVAFTDVEPVRLFRTVLKRKEDNRGKDDRRNPLEKKHPLPTRDAQLVDSQQSSRNGTADDPGQWIRRQKPCKRACPGARGKPVFQVKNDPRKKPGLTCTKEETQFVKSGGSLDKDHAAGNHAPQDHDDGHPATRADSLQREVAGHLEKEVAGKEDSECNAKDAFAEPKLRLHLQFGKAYIDPVEIIDDIEEKEKRQQPKKK